VKSKCGMIHFRSIANPLAYFEGQIVNGKLKKLEMSDTIYHRILWDPAFNAEDYVMGYLDRFVGKFEFTITLRCSCIYSIGMKEITVLNFRDPNTLETEYIPFHRIWYIRHKSGKVMWDRKLRFSLF
jgi:uncharacterized protein (UPF0248 family)